MRTVRVGLRHFYRGFTLDDFRARHPHLQAEFELVADDEDPEVVFFSVYKGRKKKFRKVKDRCVRVFYTPENVRPDMRHCDWAFSFARDIDDPRHFRLPNFAPAFWNMGRDPRELVRPPGDDPAPLLAAKDRFCLFAHSNPVPFRDRVVQALMEHKPVDCIGPVLNNWGAVVPRAEKYAFSSRYKFIFAFENSSTPGYVTEKIADAFLVRSVPLYWGDPTVAQDWDPGAFVDYAAFPGAAAFIERVLELDRDDEQYLEMLRRPCYPENRLPDHADAALIQARFRRIFDEAAARGAGR